MPLPIKIDLLELILKGIIIGIIASAPMGPVGILCIQRTLKKGRWYGFVTGIGASLSDIIYALITGLGMSFVMDLILLEKQPRQPCPSKRSKQGKLLAQRFYGFPFNILKSAYSSFVYGVICPV